MTIEIITAHEADQQIRLKAKLWPIHTTCNGNCNQGRACDCTGNIDDEWDAKPPMTRQDGLLALVLCAACWGVVAAFYLVFWGAK